MIRYVPIIVFTVSERFFVFFIYVHYLKKYTFAPALEIGEEI